MILEEFWKLSACKKYLGETPRLWGNLKEPIAGGHFQDLEIVQPSGDKKP